MFAVICDLMRMGYPNHEVELDDDEKLLIRNTFRSDLRTRSQ